MEEIYVGLFDQCSEFRMCECFKCKSASQSWLTVRRPRNIFLFVWFPLKFCNALCFKHSQSFLCLKTLCWIHDVVLSYKYNFQYVHVCGFKRCLKKIFPIRLTQMKIWSFFCIVYCIIYYLVELLIANEITTHGTCHYC